MGNITEENTWENNVYYFEETDLVKGGEDGISNLPSKQLANRTTWLKNAMRGYADLTIVTTSVTLVKVDVLLKIVVINSNSTSIELTLPILDPTDKGLKVPIVAYGVTKQVSITSQGANDIQFGVSARQKLFMGDSESLELIWLGDKWIVLDYNGNFTEVGSPGYGYSQKPNTVIANGALLSRADYPRLWQYVQTLGPSLITDFLWTNTPGYKGFFSSGDGSITFRVPDLRSMFIRGLDLGAGIDIGRNNENPGGYEADEFKSHTHNQSDDQTQGNGPGYGYVYGLYQQTRNKNTGSAGGAETRPKNIGLIPLIKT
nr:phage tail protein [Pedobacter sp. ASV19]